MGAITPTAAGTIFSERRRQGVRTVRADFESEASQHRPSGSLSDGDCLNGRLMVTAVPGGDSRAGPRCQACRCSVSLSAGFAAPVHGSTKLSAVILCRGLLKCSALFQTPS